MVAPSKFLRALGRKVPALLYDISDTVRQPMVRAN